MKIQAFSDEANERIRVCFERGDTLGAQKIILAELERTNQPEPMFLDLNYHVAHLVEQILKALEPTLIPVIKGMTDVIDRAGQWTRGGK